MGGHLIILEQIFQCRRTALEDENYQNRHVNSKLDKILYGRSKKPNV
jgi:hypothetical protein